MVAACIRLCLSVALCISLVLVVVHFFEFLFAIVRCGAAQFVGRQSTGSCFVQLHSRCPVGLHNSGIKKNTSRTHFFFTSIFQRIMNDVNLADASALHMAETGQSHVTATKEGPRKGVSTSSKTQTQRVTLQARCASERGPYLLLIKSASRIILVDRMLQLLFPLKLFDGAAPQLVRSRVATEATIYLSGITKIFMIDQ